MPFPLILAAALALTSASHRTVSDDPADFVRSIYAAFDRGGSGIHPTAKTAHRWFDPELVALIREDERQAKDEVPMLDGNPFCDCQDSADVRYSINLRRLGPATATARVRLRNAGRTTLLTIDLRRTPVGWRASDIHTAAQPSLKRFLAEGLRRHRR